MSATRRLCHRGKHMFLMCMLLVTVCLCSSRETDVDIYGLRNIVRRTEGTVEGWRAFTYCLGLHCIVDAAWCTTQARTGAHEPCPGARRWAAVSYTRPPRLNKHGCTWKMLGSRRNGCCWRFQSKRTGMVTKWKCSPWHRGAHSVSSSSLVLAVCKPTRWISPPMVLDHMHTQVMLWHRCEYMSIHPSIS